MLELFFKLWPVLIFMVAQSAIAIWWAAKTTEKVERLEADMVLEIIERKKEGAKINDIQAALAGLTSKIDLVLQALKIGVRP
jgi:hypothetical protein